MSLLRQALSRGPHGANRPRLRRTFAAVLAVGALVAGLLAMAGPAGADYGTGAVYEVEISANLTGPSGGGAWLWLALNANGTGDYSGADCGHGFGAVSDRGDVTWSSSGGWLTITGVVLNGFGGLPVTIHVPATDGHYRYSDAGAVFGIPFGGGFTQVQVAP